MFTTGSKFDQAATISNYNLYKNGSFVGCVRCLATPGAIAARFWRAEFIGGEIVAEAATKKALLEKLNATPVVEVECAPSLVAPINDHVAECVEVATEDGQYYEVKCELCDAWLPEIDEPKTWRVYQEDSGRDIIAHDACWSMLLSDADMQHGARYLIDLGDGVSVSDNDLHFVQSMIANGHAKGATDRLTGKDVNIRPVINDDGSDVMQAILWNGDVVHYPREGAQRVERFVMASGVQYQIERGGYMRPVRIVDETRSVAAVGWVSYLDGSIYNQAAILVADWEVRNLIEAV